MSNIDFRYKLLLYLYTSSQQITVLVRNPNVTRSDDSMLNYSTLSYKFLLTVLALKWSTCQRSSIMI